MTGTQLTLSRRVERPLAQSLRALDAWAATSGAAGRAIPGRFHRRLAVRRIGRPLPVELRVSAWAEDSDTLLELVPLRSLRPSARYFARARGVMEAAAASILAATSVEGCGPG